MIVKAARRKAVQRLAAEDNALKTGADALNVQHSQFTEAQIIANALRVAGGVIHCYRLHDGNQIYLNKISQMIMIVNHDKCKRFVELIYLKYEKTFSVVARLSDAA